MKVGFGASRQKTVPYLFVHLYRTEGLEDDLSGSYTRVVTPRGSGTYSMTAAPMTYDLYVSGTADGDSAGPSLKYRWRMNRSSVEPSVGTEDVTLVAAGNLTSLNTSLTGYVATTADFKRVNFTGGWPGWYEYAIGSYPPANGDGGELTIGGWWKFNGSAAQQQTLWHSSRGGIQGRHRGIYLQLPAIGSRVLDIILGDMGISLTAGKTFLSAGTLTANVQTSSVRTLRTKRAEVDVTSINFIVARFNFPLGLEREDMRLRGWTPSATETITIYQDGLADIDLFINGEEWTLTQVTSHRGYTIVQGRPSQPSGYTGGNFFSTGDTLGIQADGQVDDLFVHAGWLNNDQIARMYELGNVSAT